VKRVVVLHLRAASDSGGGPEKTIFNTARLIDPARFRYLVAYLTRGDAETAPLRARAEAEGLEYRFFPGRGFLDFGQLRAVARLVGREGVTILHCHDPKSDVCALALKAALPRLVLVSTMHGWIRRSWKSPVYNWLDTAALRWFTRVIAVSEHTARLANARGVRRTVVVHNAIDTDLWSPTAAPGPAAAHPAPAPGAFVVGYVGRLSPEKGPEDFVRVAARVLERDGSCEFVMAGDGPDAGRVRELAARLGIAARVRLLGAVRSEQMPALYRQLNLLLVPSLTEGLPNCVLEAGAMEVPVVATRVGGVPEIVADGVSGLLAGAGEIEALASHVLRLREQPRLARELAACARRTIQQGFSFTSRVRRLEALYDELAALAAPRGRASGTGGDDV
jgi:glycosyltransferase involved in cell wall biosynthesis